MKRCADCCLRTRIDKADSKREFLLLEGSITVFYTLIFGLLITFLLALLVWGKRTLLETSVSRDLDIAAEAALSEYRRDFQKEYGLYLIKTDDLTSALSFYLNENSYHPYGCYTVDSLTVTPTETLAQTAVLESEIENFMKERAVLDLLAEMKDLILGTELPEELEEEEEILENSVLLAAVQTHFEDLVEALYGVKSSGKDNKQAINLFLKGEVTFQELISHTESLLQKPTMSSIRVLGKAKTNMEKTIPCLEKGISAAEALEATLEDMALAEDESSTLLKDIPINSEQMRSAAETFRKNKDLVERALEALNDILNTPLLEISQAAEESASGEGGAGQDASETQTIPSETAERLAADLYVIKQLQIYSYEVQVPYEKKEGTGTLSLENVLRYLQGYPTDSEWAVPDEDKELNLPEEGFGTSQTAVEEESVSQVETDLSEVASLPEDTLVSRFYLAEYSLGIFRNFSETLQEQEGTKPLDLRGNEKESRYFLNETEYLLIGKNNEAKNVSAVKNRLIALRTLLNMTFLLTNTAKRQEIEAMAASTGGILLPGLGDAIAFGLILSCWSLGEAIGDYRILAEGGKIPFLKTKDSWRLELENVLDGVLENSSQKEETTTKGLDYEGYLRFLLLLTDPEVLLGRIQNLLYLNNDSFPLNQAVVSFTVEGEAFMERSLTFSGAYGYDLD